MTTNNPITLYTDQAMIDLLAQQVQQHRISLGMTQAKLSKQAGISKRSLERFESGSSVQLTSFIRILRTLGLLEKLAQLTPPAGDSPMQQVQKQKKQRVRASAPKKPNNTWNWEDEA